jgi:hypothetical protein
MANLPRRMAKETQISSPEPVPSISSVTDDGNARQNVDSGENAANIGLTCPPSDKPYKDIKTLPTIFSVPDNMDKCEQVLNCETVSEEDSPLFHFYKGPKPAMAGSLTLPVPASTEFKNITNEYDTVNYCHVRCKNL